MPGLEIHPLSDLREEAGRLLGERFARQRAAEPLLPDVTDFVGHLPDDDGVVATRGGAAVAYLAGAVDGDRVARVGFAGVAATEPEAVRDLYAVMAERWDVARFVVAVPASDDGLIDAFFRLAFGCQFMWAVRETDPLSDVAVQLHHIRLATPEDVEAVAELDQRLWSLQAHPPSYSGAAAPARDVFLAEWREVWDEPGVYTLFLAEQDGRVVGHLLLYRRPEGDLRVPPENIDLANAVTLDDVRGTGVGVALTDHALAWARESGFRSMTVDWRSVNLLSSRFWPRRGFRPQYLRLYRAVP